MGGSFLGEAEEEGRGGHDGGDAAGEGRLGVDGAEGGQGREDEGRGQELGAEPHRPALGMPMRPAPEAKEALS